MADPPREPAPIEPPPAMHGSVDAGFIIGIACLRQRNADRMVVRVDIEGLLHDL